MNLFNEISINFWGALKCLLCIIGRVNYVLFMYYYADYVLLLNYVLLCWISSSMQEGVRCVEKTSTVVLYFFYDERRIALLFKLNLESCLNVLIISHLVEYSFYMLSYLCYSMYVFLNKILFKINFICFLYFFIQL